MIQIVNTGLISPTTLVADLLAASPQVAPLFVQLRVDCTGCAMTRFCTLEDLRRDYHLDWQTLRAALATISDLQKE